MQCDRTDLASPLPSLHEYLVWKFQVRWPIGPCVSEQYQPGISHQCSIMAVWNTVLWETSISEPGGGLPAVRSCLWHRLKLFLLVHVWLIFSEMHSCICSIGAATESNRPQIWNGYTALFLCAPLTTVYFFCLCICFQFLSAECLWFPSLAGVKKVSSLLSAYEKFRMMFAFSL